MKIMGRIIKWGNVTMADVMDCETGSSARVMADSKSAIKQAFDLVAEINKESK